jgi:hypothetical protein
MTRTGQTPLALPFVLALCSAAAVAGAAEPAAPTYGAAAECGTCHTSIHVYWAESAHARSASSPRFVEASKAAPASARSECVRCHAPTALATGDLELTQPITREGVTCDFCHTVRSVSLGQPQPFDLQPGPVKRGPLDYAETPSHPTAYSALHRSSPLLCAACHEYTNLHGVAVLSTFGEWLASPYPTLGQTCQECHMPTVAGTPVTERLQPTQRRINLHRMSGAEPAQLRRGLTLRIDAFAAQGDSAQAEVAVVNSGVGHATPGGLADSRLVLVVGVENAAGKLEHARERIYRRVLRDASGQELSTLPALFLDAVAVTEDTRLKPGEARRELFTVPLAADWTALVARLEYREGAGSVLVAEERREHGR